MINRAQERCQNMEIEGVPSSSGIDIIDGETESDETPPVKKILRSTHVKISQLVNKICSHQTCSKLVNKQWRSQGEGEGGGATSPPPNRKKTFSEKG